jgi:hypothetical protein
LAYQRSNNWWLNGPQDPRGWGCDSPRGCGGGLGQASINAACADGSAPGMMGCADGSTPTCPSGYSFNGTGCSTASLLIGNPLLPVGSSATIIPGVANQYVLIAGAVLGLFLLVGLGKK